MFVSVLTFDLIGAGNGNNNVYKFISDGLSTLGWEPPVAAGIRSTSRTTYCYTAKGRPSHDFSDIAKALNVLDSARAEFPGVEIGNVSLIAAAV